MPVILLLTLAVRDMTQHGRSACVTVHHHRHHRLEFFISIALPVLICPTLPPHIIQLNPLCFIDIISSYSFTSFLSTFYLSYQCSVVLYQLMINISYLSLLPSLFLFSFSFFTVQVPCLLAILLPLFVFIKLFEHLFE